MVQTIPVDGQFEPLKQHLLNVLVKWSSKSKPELSHQVPIPLHA